jgi:hypothetical protein
MEQDLWHQVLGFENSYAINRNGVIKSISRYVRCGKGAAFLRLKPEQIIKPYLGTDGYLYVFLSYNGQTKHLAIHRILASIFIPNPENKREVNHKNTIRTDNSIDNLEWATPKENIQHSIKIGTNTQCLPGIHNPAAKLTEKQVLEIRELPGSQSSIAKKYNVSRRTIGFIKRRERWAHL